MPLNSYVAVSMHQIHLTLIFRSKTEKKVLCTEFTVLNIMICKKKSLHSIISCGNNKPENVFLFVSQLV